MKQPIQKTVLIADDETPARQRLKRLLEEMGYEVSAEAANGTDALQQCERTQPQVALLDIQMPGISGLDVAMAMSEWPTRPAVIFTTAFDSYALPAFEVHAVDYLMKPVRKERLQLALDKAEKRSTDLVNKVKGEGTRSHICVQNQGKVRLIPLDEVVYFMADQKYITVRHLGGEVLIEDSLKSLLEEFPEQFLRVHRNAIVAKNYLLALEKDLIGPYRLRLRGIEDKVEVSRRHVAKVRNEMKQL